jgi:hypothetical protein
VTIENYALIITFSGLLSMVGSTLAQSFSFVLF